MSKKIDLEKILKDTLNCHKPWELEITLATGTTLSEITAAMKEACKQSLELAAENADWEATSDCVIVRGDIFINKQSILDTINQIE